MNQIKISLGIIILFTAGLFLLNKFIGQRPDHMNVEFSPDMTNSFAFKTQSVNPFLPNNQTQQVSVIGSISRTEQLLHFSASEEDMLRAGNELYNPYAGEEVDLQRGQVVYQAFCQVCHGAGGTGDGSVVLRGFPAPPSLLLENSKNRKDGQMFHMISFGYKNMPAYASQIDQTDRWQVIHYVRKLQENQQE